LAAPGHKIDIASDTLYLSPRHRLKTTAYNGQVPGTIAAAERESTGHRYALATINGKAMGLGEPLRVKQRSPATPFAWRHLAATRQRARRPWRAVGGRAHSPARSGTGFLGVAGWREPFDRNRLLALRLLDLNADYGAIGNICPVHNQQKQVFLVTDLNLSPVWEINIGVGIGAT
jgi:hypothetical protein